MDKFIAISISVRVCRFKAVSLLAHRLKFTLKVTVTEILSAATLKTMAHTKEKLEREHAGPKPVTAKCL